MDVSLFFAGTAGSVPTARRGLPALLLRAGGERILFDCGEGTQQQLLRSIGLPELDARLPHALPPRPLARPARDAQDVRPARAGEGRSNVYGPPGTKRLFTGLRPIIGRTGYPLELVDLEPHAEVRFDSFLISPFPVKHRGEAYGYAFVEDERPGRFDVDAARALGVRDGPDFGRLQRGEAVGGVTPEQVMGETRAGRRIVISGDTAPCQAVEVFAHGADVLVHEATFMEDERARARETGHSTARQAAEIAREANVRLLALTHLSTRYFPREIRDEAREVFPNTFVPRDFDEIAVPFPERGEPTLVKPDREPEPAAAP